MKVVKNLFTDPYKDAFRSLKIGKEELYYSLNGRVSSVGKDILSNVKLTSRTKVAFKGFYNLGFGCVKLLPFINALIWYLNPKTSEPPEVKPEPTQVAPPATSNKSPPNSTEKVPDSSTPAERKPEPTQIPPQATSTSKKPSPKAPATQEGGIENAGNTCYINAALHSFNAFAKSIPSFDFEIKPAPFETKEHFATRKQVAQSIKGILTKIRSGKTCEVEEIRKLHTVMTQYNNLSLHPFGGLASFGQQGGDSRLVFDFLQTIFFQPSHFERLFEGDGAIFDQLPDKDITEYAADTERNRIKFFELSRTLPNASKLSEPLVKHPSESDKAFALRKAANDQIQNLLNDMRDNKPIDQLATTDLWTAMKLYYKESNNLAFFKSYWKTPKSFPQIKPFKFLYANIIEPNFQEKIETSSINPSFTLLMQDDSKKELKLLDELDEYLGKEFDKCKRENSVFEVTSSTPISFPPVFGFNLALFDRKLKEPQKKEIPLQFTLKSNGQNATYQLTGVRKGTLYHSIFYGYSQGVWRLYDDSRISKLSDADAYKNISLGDIFIYTKV